MKSFWDLKYMEKRGYVNEKIRVSKPVDSLSNNVFVIDNVVIKRKEDIDDRKSRNELNYLSSNNIKFEVVENNLIIERINGVNLTNNDVGNKLIITKIIDSILKFKETNRSGVVKYNLFDKLISAEEEIIFILSKFNIDNKYYYKVLDLSRNEEENILSHSDLNDNNILVDETNVYLIDFEEVTLGNKYHDITSFISNWDIEEESIQYICSLLNIDIENTINLSIIWTARYYIWNEKQFLKTNDQKYKDKMEFFESRMKYLSKIK